jgi:sugar O-acyltransferase (sialic acid O-acetyltransferase NeuD family)
MTEVIVFGTGQNSQIAAYYLDIDSEFKLKGFCVDDKYMKDQNGLIMGRPIHPLSEILRAAPPDKVKMFAPLYGKNMGNQRKDVYLRLKSLGYSFITYISSKAHVFTKDIGENVLILEGNTIQPFTRIGNNVSVWSNNHIGHHTCIGAHSSITSHVVVSGNCTIGENCFLGVNSSIKDGINLAKYTFIGMGSSITHDSEEGSVYTSPTAEKRSIDSRKIKY